MKGMVVAVWIPLLIPLLAAPLVRVLAEHLAPRPASWLLAATGALLAGSATLSLGLLTGAGLLRLGFVAAAEHLSPPLLRRMSPTPLPLACAAGLALVVTVGVAGWTLHRRVTALRAAANATPSRRGGLAVLPDDLPDAYAVPGRPGTVVVTTGMLRALNAREREVLFAHECAHLSCRHHWFALVMDAAAALHPALIALRAPLRYHLERWADESAASALGDRRLVARAIARAALARDRAGARAAPPPVLSATAGPVPRRVAALLAAPPARRPRLLPGIAAALVACMTLSGAGALDAATDLRGSMEAMEVHHHGVAGHRHGYGTVLATAGQRTPSQTRLPRPATTQ